MPNIHVDKTQQHSRTYARAIITILLCVVFLRASNTADAQPRRVFDPFTTTADINVLRAEAEQSGTLRVIVGVQTGGHATRSLDMLSSQFSAAADVQRQQIIRGMQTQVIADLSASGGHLVPQVLFDYIPYMTLEVDARALDALARNPFVTSIENDALSHVDMNSSAAVIGASGAGGAWAKGYTGAGYAVAVLDTGVDKSHPHLSTRVVSEACYNVINAGITSRCPGGAASSVAPGSGVDCPSEYADGCGHGTHVAGTVAGTDGIYRGIAYEAKIIAINVFSLFPAPTNPSEPCYGYNRPCILSSTTNQIQAMERVYALRNTYKIAAVNMSIGGGYYTSEANCDAIHASRKEIITRLRSVNIATVVSAGNDAYINGMGAPGCISVAISVGASSDQDEVAWFSNNADFLDIFAPGMYITAADAGTTTTITYQGTSMAAPHIAGAWAVLRQANPNADVSTILSVIQSTGISIMDTRVGAGNRIKPRIRLSHAIDALVPPTSPAGLAAVADGQTQITLSWDNVSHETGFAIERSPNGSSSWTPLTTTASDVTSYSDTTAVCGRSYYYRVSAVNAGGRSAPSNTAQATSVVCPPAKPLNLSAAPISQTQIDLLWSDVAGETAYTIEHSANGTDGWIIIGTNAANGITFSHTDLSCGTDHYYRVIAANIGGSSAPSTPAFAATVVCTPPQPTGLSATAAGQMRIELAWADVQGEESYIIERSLITNDDWKYLGTTAANVMTYSDTVLSCDTPVHYRVSARNAGGDSAPSAIASAITVICVPVQPAGLTASAAGESQINLNWGDVTGETGYRIERSVNGISGWVSIGTNEADDTDFSDAGLSCGETRHYRIIAINSGGDSIPSSTTAATTLICLPTQPTGLSAAHAGHAQINLTWIDSAYEASYRVEHSDDGTTGWTEIDSLVSGSVTFSHTGLTCDTTHHYRVIAVNARGVSAPSAVISTTTGSCIVTTELLKNGNFELDTNRNNIPDGWKGKKLKGDKLKCRSAEAYSGTCAFLMKGSAKEKATLIQNVKLSGVSMRRGDTLTFSVMSQGKNARLSAKIVMTITLAGKKKPKVIKASLPRSDAYMPVSTAAFTIGAKRVKAIKVSIVHKSRRGNLWLDSASLLLTRSNSPDISRTDILPLPPLPDVSQ